jgi:hypothetical protein
MVFKFSFSNKFNFGGKGSIGGKNLASTWNSIKSFFSGKAVEEAEPKNFAEGSGESSLICEGSGSLDISVEEMVGLLKYQVESDQCAWDLLKEMGKDLLKGEKTVRDAAKTAIPEWQEICHKADLQNQKNSHESVKAHFEYSKKNAEAAKTSSKEEDEDVDISGIKPDPWSKL